MDWRYIQEELAPLCEAKEEPEILDRLISLNRSFAPRVALLGSETAEDRVLVADR